MSRVKIRYFVEKPQKGGHSLFYWQPSAALVRAGFMTRRLAEGTNHKGEALKQAEALNRQLDAWRGGKDAVPSRVGTIPWLIRLYMADEAFTQLQAATKISYEHRMRLIEKWSERAGHPPIKSITRKVAKGFYRSLKASPIVRDRSQGGAPIKDPVKAAQRRAADVIAMCRVLWRFAKDDGEVDTNPFTEMGVTGSPPRQQVWTDQQIADFIEAAENFAPPPNLTVVDIQQRAALAAELAVTLPTSREARRAAAQQLLDALPQRGAAAQLARDHGISNGALTMWRQDSATPSNAMLDRLLSDDAPLPTGTRAKQAAEIIGGISASVVEKAIRRMREDPEAHERAKVGAIATVKPGSRKIGYRSVGLAVTIAANTAQRDADILHMAWSQYDGTKIRLKQRKTGAFLDIPVTADLKAALDATPRVSPLIVVNEKTGRPWRAGSFDTAFRKIARAAGIPDDLQYRDLRRSSTVKLAEAGCSVPEIAAIGGWSVNSVTKMLEIYMPRNTAMARHAITKLEEYRRTQRQQELEGS